MIESLIYYTNEILFLLLLDITVIFIYFYKAKLYIDTLLIYITLTNYGIKSKNMNLDNF